MITRQTIAPKWASVLALCGLPVLLSLWCAVPAWAGKYVYGESFVRSDQHWREAGQQRAAQHSESPAAGQDEQAFLSEMSEMEQAGGPYAPGLAETLVGLGRYYFEQGDMARAQEVYRRALHVVRINDGLYSERQVPIVRAQLDAYRNSGQLQALDGLYDYYFRLFGAGAPPYTELRLRAALAYLRWQREALRLSVDKDGSERMLYVYYLNKELIEAAAREPAVAPHWHSELALSQLQNLYLLQNRFSGLENKSMAPAASPFASQWDDQQMAQLRLQRMRRGALSLGGEVIATVISRHGEGMTAEDLAGLYLAWADWYQWQGREERAAEQYREVVRLLDQADRADLLQQWLGEPVELPDNGAFWQPQPVAQAAESTALTVHYDVTADGEVRNVSAEVVPQQESALKRLARRLRATPFRPAWASGTPEPAYQIRRQYLLLD